MGQRLVADLMVELSYHLVDNPFIQNLTAPATAGPGAELQVASTEFLYPGAMIVVGWQDSDAEVATVVAVQSDTMFTANLVNNHASGEECFGATFPCQQPTDPIFTQSEIIDYIAQAQNEFLAKVPLILEPFPDNLLTLGVQVYPTPDTAIEMERVAIQSTPDSTTFDIATISRTGGTVTCVLAESVNSDSWTAGLPILILGVTDTSFNSVNNAKFLLESVSVDGLTLTWAQDAADSSSTGGQAIRPILTRLYESSQEQIAMNYPYWTTNPDSAICRAWYQDRTGVYNWGVAPIPQAGYYCDLLCSVRGSESLNLLSGFLVPDLLVYAIKAKVLQYIFSKNGVQRSPIRAAFFGKKFDFWVLLADRFLRNSIEKTGR